MEHRESDRAKWVRYRNITERLKAILFLLREIPFITSRDIFRYFYPSQKNIHYSREMMRVLLRDELVHKCMLGDGAYIYFITEHGRQVAEFFEGDTPKFHAPTKSFFYSKPPRSQSEAVPFFIFPTPDLEFQLFTPHRLHSHPFEHTVSLLELYYLLRNSFRFLRVVWLDQVHGKKSSLNIPFHPDLLLCNSLATEAHRLYVELENSRINADSLVEKLNHLSTLPADWYLFLCTSKKTFLNIGRLIRKILMGEVTRNQTTLHFSPRAQSAIWKNVFIGFWAPTIKSHGEIHRLKDVTVYRYDDEIFDKEMWVNATEGGMVQNDESSGLPLKRRQAVPYPSRRPGPRNYRLTDLFNRYVEEFKAALEKELNPPEAKPGSEKGSEHDRP